MEEFRKKYYDVIGDYCGKRIDSAFQELLFDKYDGEANDVVLSVVFGSWLKQGEGIKRHNYVIDYFSLLYSSYLDYKGILKDSDLVQMLLFMVKTNIENGLLEKRSYRSIEVAMNSTVTRFVMEMQNDPSLSKFDKLVRALDFSYLKRKNDRSCLSLCFLFHEELMKLYKKIHNEINEHCFLKGYNMDEEDIELVAQDLIDLNLVKEQQEEVKGLKEKIKIHLRNLAMVHEEKKPSDEVVKEKVDSSIEEKSVPLVEAIRENDVAFALEEKEKAILRRENYKLLKEIDCVFDLEKSQLREEFIPSYELIRVYALKFYQCGIDEKKRNYFVTAAFRKLKLVILSHPFERLNLLKRQLEFYGLFLEDAVEIYDGLNEFVGEYMLIVQKREEAIKTQNKRLKKVLNKDVREWEEIIETEFKKLEAMLPISEEFEKAEIKNVLKR